MSAEQFRGHRTVSTKRIPPPMQAPPPPPAARKATPDGQDPGELQRVDQDLRPKVVPLVDDITMDQAATAVATCQRLGLLESPGGWMFLPAGVDPKPLIERLALAAPPVAT